MIIVKSKNLDKYAIEKRNWQGIPSMDIDKYGTLFASWYSGGSGEGEFNYVMIQKSIDNGLSFSAPMAVVDPPGNIRAYDPAVFTDPSGNVRWYWAQSNGMYDGTCGVWESIFHKGVFGLPKRICDGIMMNKPTILKDGRWLLPSSLWNMDPYFRHSDGPIEVSSRVTTGSYAVESDDDGRSFHPLGRAVTDSPSCDEHMIIVISSRNPIV